MPPPTLSDPSILAQIDGLAFRARRVVEGTISGQHRSPFHGFAVEFAEHREYAPGDDLRRLDWRIFSRSDRHYIKQYEEESNLRAMLVVDASRSMRYQGDRSPLSKYAYASIVAAGLASLLIGQQDPVGLALFDREERALLPASATQAQLARIIEMLEQSEPNRETDLGQVLASLAEKLRRRGLLILLSDFLTDGASLEDGLDRLLYRGHEVIAFQILDRDELELPFDGPTLFRDLEGDEQLFAEPWAFRQAYQQAMDGFLRENVERCRARAIDHALFQTHEDIGQKLSFFLHART